MNPRFIVLVALLTSLMALGTDAMLPALPEIGVALGVVDANRTQLMVSVFFLGTGIGQLMFGPFSDYLGRKFAILFGLVLFSIGCVVSYFAQSFEIMLAGRLLQGFGVAGPRIGSIAMVRDLYRGREMARVMSFVMVVFILVPAIAPLLGQTIMQQFGWRSVFLAFIVFGGIAFVWMALGQGETQSAENRHRFSWADLGQSILIVLTNRQTMAFAGIGGLTFSALVVYLSSAEQIFHDIFDTGELFPLFFAIMALAIGASSFANAHLVMRVGMQKLISRALMSMIFMSIIYLLVVTLMPNAQILPVFLAWGIMTFFSVGLLFGNMNALAMEPMGKNAGVAAAVVGAMTTLVGVGAGVPLAQLYNGTTTPLVASFMLLGVLSLIGMYYGTRLRQPIG